MRFVQAGAVSAVCLFLLFKASSFAWQGTQNAAPAVALPRIDTVDVPGRTDTAAIGVNDHGQIVGWFTDAMHRAHGFLLSKGSFISIDIPGAEETMLTGINDSGQ